MFDYQLPLPPPWTLASLSEYVSQLSQFIAKYREIGEFVSSDRFVKEAPVNWGENFCLETWLEIVVGEYKGQLPDDFAEYMRLSRTLRLVENPSPTLHAAAERLNVGEGATATLINEVPIHPFVRLKI